MARACVWNLFRYPADTSRLHDEDAVVPGRFEFSFRLDYEDRSVVVCDQNTDVGLGWPLARLELSPVSVYLELDGLPENEMNPAFDTSIVLIGLDGSRQELVSDWDHEQTGEGIPGLSFSQDEKTVRMLLQAIDPAQYAAVEVNGVSFPLEKAAGCAFVRPMGGNQQNKSTRSRAFNAREVFLRNWRKWLDSAVCAGYTVVV